MWIVGKVTHFHRKCSSCWFCCVHTRWWSGAVHLYQNDTQMYTIQSWAWKVTSKIQAFVWRGWGWVLCWKWWVIRSSICNSSSVTDVNLTQVQKLQLPVVPTWDLTSMLGVSKKLHAETWMELESFSQRKRALRFITAEPQQKSYSLTKN